MNNNKDNINVIENTHLDIFSIFTTKNKNKKRLRGFYFHPLDLPF